MTVIWLSDRAHHAAPLCKGQGTCSTNEQLRELISNHRLCRWLLIPTGTMKDGAQEAQLLMNAIPETIAELNDTIVKVVDGVPVKISDVGLVENSAQIQSNIVRINGARKAYIPIYRQPGANSIEIVRTIKKNLANILTRLKTERMGDGGIDTLDVQVAMDQSIPVQESIAGLQ